jgi:acyl-Coa thioesterase superfamily protein
MNTRTICTGRFTLPLSPDEALPLFTPEGERLWAGSAWDPVYAVAEAVEDDAGWRVASTSRSTTALPLHRANRRAMGRACAARRPPGGAARACAGGGGAVVAGHARTRHRGHPRPGPGRGRRRAHAHAPTRAQRRAHRGEARRRWACGDARAGVADPCGRASAAVATERPRSRARVSQHRYGVARRGRRVSRRDRMARRRRRPRRAGAGDDLGRIRFPLVPHEEPSGLQRMLILADSGNGVSSVLPWTDWLFINTELTVHIAAIPSGEWICLDAHTRVDPRGFGLAASRLFDRQRRVGRGARSTSARGTPPAPDAAKSTRGRRGCATSPANCLESIAPPSVSREARTKAGPTRPHGEVRP